MEIEARVAEFRTRLDALEGEIGRVIVGHREAIQQVLCCLVAGGHALLEGVPGLGKTLLVRTLSECCGLKFSRIQFTPDLMPADILGTNLVVEDASGRRTFQFQPGPIFGNLILADEVNRATPKTQSALLEAMQERGVTVAGIRHELESPFFVLATQNPIEMEGTYPLPEAQLDRFLFKIVVGSSGVEEMVKILERTTGTDRAGSRGGPTGADLRSMQVLVREVPAAGPVLNYAARLVAATHPNGPEAPTSVKQYVRYGASPRGAQALVLGAKVLALWRGRPNVSFADVREVALPALRHRVLMNFEGEAAGVKSDDLVRKILESTAEGQKPGRQAG